MFGFKRSAKTVQTPAAPQVEAAAAAWGIAPTVWATLSPEARRDYRDRIAYAGRADGFGRPNA